MFDYLRLKFSRSPQILLRQQVYENSRIQIALVADRATKKFLVGFANLSTNPTTYQSTEFETLPEALKGYAELRLHALMLEGRAIPPELRDVFFRR